MRILASQIIMEPLKEMFNVSYYTALAKEIKKADDSFKHNDFIKDVTFEMNELSLNQRLRRTSVVLKNYLPKNYKQSVSLLKKVIIGTPAGYTNLVFPDFVGLYGHEDTPFSLEALKYFTRFGSSEFAIREYLKRDFETTLEVMKDWAHDKNEHVRRLASEGSRPRLPWSFKLDRVIKEPQLTASILKTLNADNSLYVRKSVANHLNDISKENSDYLIRVLNSWDKTHPHTAWIIKHASRSLIKKGDPSSLKLFDYEKSPALRIDNLKLKKSSLKLGEKLEFSFDLISEKNKTQKLVVDYIIHYQKKSGSLSPKVFKLKDIQLQSKEKVTVSKSQVFKDFTTRKHFPGEHKLEIQINGKVYAIQPFKLVI